MVALSHGWQSEATDGPTGRWGLLSFSLFLSLSFSFSDYLPTYLPTLSLSVCLSNPSIYLSISKLENETILRDVLRFLNLTTWKTKQFYETSSMFELDNIKNEAILRDVFIFQSWQHQKRSNSARHLQFLNLKNKAIRRNLLQKWKVECRADGLVTMRFAIFPLHLSKVLRLPRKLMPGHTKCCTCHAKSS